jgi:hypothetical protein
LECAEIPERLLDRMKIIPAGGQTLDRFNVGSSRLERQDDAGLGRLIVNEDRASAADTLLAPDVNTGQSEPLAQEVDESEARLNSIDGNWHPVHMELDPLCHAAAIWIALSISLTPTIDR